MERLKDIFRLRKTEGVSICRVSDLLKKGFDAERLAEEFVRVNQEVWKDITDSRYLWTKEMVLSHFRICPHIIYCAFAYGEIVATLTNMATTEEEFAKNKSWLEKTGNGYLTTHIPKGNIGFGVDLSVAKEAPRRVSDKLVLAAIFIGAIGEGVKSVHLGSRIPRYHKHKDMKVEDYVFGKTPTGRPLDPELYFYVKHGFEIMEIIPDYMEDPESLNYGILIKWTNPLYKITKALPFLKAGIRFAGRLLFLQTHSVQMVHE